MYVVKLERQRVNPICVTFVFLATNLRPSESRNGGGCPRQTSIQCFANKNFFFSQTTIMYQKSA